MSSHLGRTVGWIFLVADIGLAVYMFYGPPRDWDGAMQWLYYGLMLAAVGAIHLIVKLIFPETEDDAQDYAGEDAGDDAKHDEPDPSGTVRG